MPTPEEHAREKNDVLLTQAGWISPDANHGNLSADRSVVIRNFSFEQRHGFADYLFYVDGRTAEAIHVERDRIILTLKIAA